MPDPTPHADTAAIEAPGATLLFAVYLPGADHDVDPEIVADEFVEMINEERERNGGYGGYGGPVAVSGIPPAQWVTSKGLKRLREQADDLARLRAENERLCGLLRALRPFIGAWEYTLDNLPPDQAELLAELADSGGEYEHGY